MLTDFYKGEQVILRKDYFSENLRLLNKGSVGWVIEDSPAENVFVTVRMSVGNLYIVKDYLLKTGISRHDEDDNKSGSDHIHSYTDVLLGKTEEYTGGSSDYYQVEITNPTTEGRESYIAECNDIIEALGMNFAEGNIFKAIWRRAAHRTLGKKKAGSKEDGLYDAEKVVFFGERLVAQSKAVKSE